MLEEDMMEQKVWAVIGATHNTDKFGYKIYKRLKSKDYKVFPVNPGLSQIEGDPCYKDLAELPQTPDVLNMVVRPERTRQYLEEAARLGIRYIWLQPGTYDDETIELAKKLGLQYVKACVLVAVR